MTRQNRLQDRRIHNIALTARLGYLNHISERQVASWMERLKAVLAAGGSWLPGRREEDPPMLDQADLYSELEHLGFRQLLALQREAGQQALLAALVLLQVELGNRDAALKVWSRLRHFRDTHLARKVDLAGYRRRQFMAHANSDRLASSRKIGDEIKRDAKRLLAAGTGKRDIVGILSQRNALSPSQIRRILKK